MKMKEFGLTETKLFHSHRIFKRGIQANPLNSLWIHHCDGFQSGIVPPLSNTRLQSTLQNTFTMDMQ